MSILYFKLSIIVYLRTYVILTIDMLKAPFKWCSIHGKVNKVLGTVLTEKVTVLCT